ncbi:bifunctional tetrahydrofolate synthase/dihydrofolate synthase [Paucibacter sp. Y2R2-4]|uniref:bifunctional tetrahydrofolate synthase/dihydrofolate synthase n=1 Tax=Paucibacter sp. Y2R2-4 TaxID=2893553 RepID=UPI0021E40F31|nr:bifunctional tetrahydrofolate synthase/dihydrofolate synthase [Paucibacter sp. Y2R2-4]MCV2348197.1 bifunctional tetrahydrofolate synthase/dihydrofolate synthase [Paucibacter sp. Y2R2-4]
MSSDSLQPKFAHPESLDAWLAHCERLHPKTIDMTLDRVIALRDRLGLKFETPVVMVAGTNGKGSTCAMLESIALQAGYRVGLYIKPHLVHFQERCRVGGEPVSADSLLPYFEAVEAARGEMTLSYFEFTTLVIMLRLAAEPLDLVILEVGLGGRLDAVNAIDADCSVITSIDLDHTEYLGPDRESVGREKAGIMRAGRPVVVSDPMPPASLAARAKELGADLRQLGVDFTYAGDRQQWQWSGRSRRFSGMAYPALRGVNQLLNAAGVLAVFEALYERLPISAQAVRNGLAMVELPGRFQVLAGQPALVLDVAHNPHAVAALAQNLDQMGFFPCTHAVFGSMADKDIEAIFRRMAPLIDVWHFCDLDLPRAATAAALLAQFEQLRAAGELKAGAQVTLHQHGDPLTALNAAAAGADPADRILVFGSFHTVGGVLKNGVPRLQAGKPAQPPSILS